MTGTATVLPDFNRDIPQVDLPALEFDPQLFDGIQGAILAGALTGGAPVEIPDFSSVAKRVRHGIVRALRQLADAIEAQEAQQDVQDAPPAPRDLLAAFMNLQDNWDDEGAPRPDNDAIERAFKVLDWAESRLVEIIDVDVDVLGGVAVRLWKAPDKMLWIACMNNKHDTAVWSQGNRVIGHSEIDVAKNEYLDMFLPFLEVPHGA